MKISTLQKTLLFACALYTGDVMAQITITKADYPIASDPAKHRRSYCYVENYLNYKTPSGGADMLWDFRATTGNFLADFNYYKSNDPFFSAGIHFEAARLELSTFGIPTDFHHRFDDKGYTEFGKEQHDTTISLADVTGTPGDNVHFTPDKQLYNGEIDRVLFPITYQQTWSNNMTRKTPYELTIQGFGLNKVPGYHELHMAVSNEVIGYGNLLMTYKGANSDTMEVLLIKTVQTVIDSFFLGGGPAPDALVQGLGLEQGSKQTIVTYSYYRKGWGDLMLEIRSDEETPGVTPTGMYYSVYGIEYPASVQNPKMVNSTINMFPNPSKAGSTLYMEWNEKIQATASYQIIDLQGKVLANCMDLTSTSNSAEIRLPSQMPKGIYFVQALNASGAVLFQKKLVIAE